MAKIGIKFPVFAPISSYGSDGMPVYNGGFVIGKAITAEKSIESNDNPLYADDAVAENDTSFASGSIKLGVADFGRDYADSLQVQGKLLGQTVTELTGGGFSIRRSALTSAPYGGFGFYKTKKHNGKIVYEATWLYKVIFKTPSESTNTKGSSIEWQTPEIEGTIMAVDGFDNDTYEDTAIFETETAAKSWLCGRASLEPNADRTLLNATIAAVDELDPEVYTSASWAALWVIKKEVDATVTKTYMSYSEVNALNAKLSGAKNQLTQRSAE